MKRSHRFVTSIRKTMTLETAEIVTKALEYVDQFVELYLGSVIKPFVAQHEKFYSALNKVLRGLLDENKAKIPDWFTANFITYFRTVLVIPCILLMAKDHLVVPSLLIILVDFGDFLDGVVARFWVDRKEEIIANNDGPSSPTGSDDESFGMCNFILCFVLQMVLGQVHLASHSS